VEQGPTGRSEVTAQAERDRTLPVMERPAREKLILTIGIEEAGHKLKESALKSRFICNLIEREIELACLDEAINIFEVGKPKSERERKEQLKAQANKLKTFGNKTPTTIVLAGAYDFFEMTLVSGQIARRSSIVHMEPYTMTKEGLVGFAEALIGLLSHLPIEHELDPELYAAEFFLQSLGCVGTLKNILSTALNKSLSRNRPLSISLVRESYFTAAQLEVMSSEMRAGVARVRELMTMEQLAAKSEDATSKPVDSSTSGGRKLAPGETKPSHRHDAADQWDSA